MRDKALFGAASVALSLGLFAVEWWLRSVGFYVPAGVGFDLPVIAVIVCALGVTWRRKALTVAIALGALTALDLLGEATGLQWAASYASTSLLFPVAVLVIFVGMNPSVLWTRAPQGPRAKSTGKSRVRVK
jgi:hypothetical protein